MHRSTGGILAIPRLVKLKGERMLTFRLAMATLVAALSVSAVPAAEDDPADEKPWLNEEARPALVQPRVFEAQPGDGELARLLKQRHNAAQDELRERYTFWLQPDRLGGGLGQGR